MNNPRSILGLNCLGTKKSPIVLPDESNSFSFDLVQMENNSTPSSRDARYRPAAASPSENWKYLNTSTTKRTSLTVPLVTGRKRNRVPLGEGTEDMGESRAGSRGRFLRGGAGRSGRAPHPRPTPAGGVALWDLQEDLGQARQSREGPICWMGWYGHSFLTLNISPRMIAVVHFLRAGNNYPEIKN